MTIKNEKGKVVFTIIIYIFCLIGAVYAKLSWAAKEEKGSPPVITSDSIEMLKKGKTVFFKGNVKLVKGDIIITADEMVNFVDEDKVEGKGNVHFISVGEEKEIIEVKSDFMEYFDKDKKVVLTGSPWVYQDTKDAKGEYTGTKMTFFREEERFIIEGNAKAIIYSKESSEEKKAEENKP